MVRRTFVTLVAGASLVVSVSVLPTNSANAADVDVVVENDLYVGTGAVILPPGVSESDRSTLSRCEGCSWRVTTPCIADPRGDAHCRAIVGACAAEDKLIRLWFRPAGGEWRDRGLICVEHTTVVPVRQAQTQVRQRVEHAVPRGVPFCLPNHHPITQIPLRCSSGTDGEARSWTDVLAGISVTVSTRPRWVWDFGSGARYETGNPGGSYPQTAVAHTYRTPGERTVGLTTIWSGEYTMDGLGPFPLAPIEQYQGIPVSIGQGRAVVTLPSGTGRG